MVLYNIEEETSNQSMSTFPVDIYEHLNMDGDSPSSQYQELGIIFYGIYNCILLPPLISW